MMRIPRSTAWLLLSLVALFAWSYHATLLTLLNTWNSDPDYQHGFFVLPLAIAILWRRRDEFSGDIKVEWLGVLLLIIAAGIRWFSIRFYYVELDAWSILPWLCGAVWVACGVRCLLWALPAIMFLGFACPLPSSVELALSNQLQAIAAAGSAFTLQCLGRPAILDGTTVLLNGIELDIERACSGLRMFFGAFAVAFGYGMLGKAGNRMTTIFVFLAIPVSILGNVLRIVVTGLLFEVTGDETVRAMEHDFAGIAMMIFMLAVFAGFHWQLNRWRIASEKRPHVFARRIAFWPITLAVLIASIFGLHYVQSGHAVAQLVSMAEQASESDEPDSAARYWDLVIRMDPNHLVGLQRLADLLAESRDFSARRRALELASRASNLAPEDLAIGKRRVEIANSLSAHGDTISAANRMLTNSKIGETANKEYRQFAARWRANAIYSLLHSMGSPGALTWNDLGKALEVAIQHDPRYPQHYFRLAINLRTRTSDRSKSDLADAADATIALMLERNSESAEAWLVRYRYARRFSMPDRTDAAAMAEIDGYLDRALELHLEEPTKNAHVLVSAAERERDRGNTMASVELFEQAIAADPADTRPYLAISEMVAQPGNQASLDKSIAVLRDGVRAIGNRELPLILPLIRHLSARDFKDEAAHYLEIARQSVEAIPDPQKTEYRIQLAYVEALLLAREHRFADAADHLQTIIESFDSNQVRVMRTEIAQVWGNVAQYRRMCGDLDNVIEAFKNAASLDASWRAHMLQWVARTRSPRSDADAFPQEIARGTTDPWLDAARFALRQQLLLPPAVRDWSQYRHAIESARDESVADEIICLDANQYAINGQWKKAKELLRQAAVDYPDSPLIYRTLALLYTKEGDLESAIELVGKIDSDSLRAESLVLLKSELLCTANQYDEALDLLKRTVKESTNDELARELQVEIARILTRIGDWEQAKEILSSIPAAGDDALRIVEMLSRLAWCQRDWKTLESCEKQLRTIEGDKGALWRTCRIRRLLGQSSRDADVIGEASDLAQDLRSLHPDLQMTRVSSARVATYRGLLWEAVAHYEDAWALGSPRVTLAVDLIALLNELGQTEKAQRYVNDARMFMRASDQMIDRSLVDFVYDTDVDTIRFAEAWVQSHENSDGYLRYGRTLALAALPGSDTEAERLERSRVAFEKAVELNPRDIRAWGALYRFYVAARPNAAKAQDVLNRLATHEGITELDRAFALAQLRESIGKVDAAAEKYSAAIALLNGSVDQLSHLVVYERAAQFFQHHDLEKAAKCSREALAIDPNSMGARSVLIDVLLAQKNAESVAEAESLFLASIDEQEMSAAEQRRHAEILRAMADINVDNQEQLHTKAVALLESIDRKTTLDTLMVTLSELELNKPATAASKLNYGILAKNLDIQVLVKFLSEHRELPRKHPDFAPVFEQAFLRIEEHAGHEIESLRLRLDQLRATESDDSGDKLKNLVSLIVDQHAERCLGRLRTQSQRHELIFHLLDFLLKADLVTDAVRLAKLSPPPESPLRWAATLAVALAVNHARCEVPEEAERLLVDSLAVRPTHAELNFAIGNLWYLQGKSDDAVACYRQAADSRPDHWLTMNNLAVALADSNLDESFSLVEKAIALVGRDPVLLDTLAVLQLKNGQPQLAIDTIHEMSPQAELDAPVLIHLAMAFQQTGDTNQALHTFQLIDHQVIKEQGLSPMDGKMYFALQQEFSDKE